MKKHIGFEVLIVLETFYTYQLVFLLETVFENQWFVPIQAYSKKSCNFSEKSDSEECQSISCGMIEIIPPVNNASHREKRLYRYCGLYDLIGSRCV